MKTKAYWFRALAIIALAMAMTGSVSAQSTTSAVFTYQGYLELGGAPVSNTCDFQFGLWDAVSSGNQINTTQTVTAAVSKGIFNAVLDFGGTAFNGDARWLEIAVRCPTGSGLYATLTPRSALNAVPYAAYALHTSWSGLSNIPAGFADGVDDTGSSSTPGNQLALNGNTLNVVEGSNSDLDADLLDGNHASYYQTRVGGNCTEGSSIRVINADGSVTCQAVPGAAQVWNMSTWTSALTVSNDIWTSIPETYKVVNIQYTGQMLIIDYSLGFQASGDPAGNQVVVKVYIDSSPVDTSVSTAGGVPYVNVFGRAFINTISPGLHSVELRARVTSTGTTWTNTITSGTYTGRSLLITLYP